MGWSVIIAPAAQADLERIVSFIARDNPDAAARMGYDLILRAEVLTSNPKIGRVVPEFKQEDLRETVYRSYRIIYRLKPSEQRIEIVRFWHGARGFPEVLPSV